MSSGHPRLAVVTGYCEDSKGDVVSIASDVTGSLSSPVPRATVSTAQYY